MNSDQSYKGLASLVASRGGGDDTMLVHMTPGEVQGLQSLAMAHGGSLEINPETGLYKAGFLKSILPTLAGALLAPFTGGLSAALLVGAGTGLIEKDWKKGLLAGLGAFGGAGLSSALTSTGTKALEAGASEALKKTAESAATSSVFSPTGAAAQQLVSSAAPQGMKFALGDTLKAGISQLGTEGGRAAFTSAIPGIGGAFGGKAAMAAAAAPMLLAEPEPLKAPKAGPTMYYTGTEFEQELNPERNELGQPYFTQRFTPGQFTTQMPGMAEGGEAKADTKADTKTSFGPAPSLEEYYRSLLTAPASRSTPANPAFSDYMSKMNPFLTSGAGTSPTYVPPPPKVAPPTDPTKPPPPPPPPPPPARDKDDPRDKPDRDDPYKFDPNNLQNFQFDPEALRNFQMYGMEGFSPFVPGYNPYASGPTETYNPQTQKFETQQADAGIGTPDTPNTALDAFKQQLQSNPLAAFRSIQDSDTTSIPPGLDIYSQYGQNELMDFSPGMMQFNRGGISTLGGYSDGGRLLKGPGDGMSDSIPAEIRGRRRRQPARLADGEFVVPADVVSHLGNGSTDAGAKKLYQMMDKVRRARTKTTRQAKPIKSDKYLPR